MKLKVLATFFLFAFLIIACKTEDDETLELPAGAFENLLEAKLFFFEEATNNNLITTVDQVTIDEIDYCQFTMEDEAQVLVNKTMLDSFVTDPGAWLTQLYFSDGSIQDAGFLGDSIYIDENNTILDPFGTAPLTALIKTRMPVKGKFGLKLFPKEAGAIGLEHEFAHFDFFHEIPVLGLFPEYNNEIEIYFRSESGQLRASKTIQIETDRVSGAITVDIEQNLLAADDTGIYVVSDKKMGFDQTGETRWVYLGDGKQFYRKLKNGNLIMAAQQGGISYHSSKFYELSMLGQIVRTFEVPNKMHHEVIEMPNGNFLVASNSAPFTGNRNDGQLEEDLIVEIDRSSGEVIKSWDLNEVLNNDRPRLDGSTNDDWLHMNALVFDEDDQSILFNSRHQSVLGKLDYETGEVKWLLAHPSGWKSELEPFILTPIQENGSPVDLATTDFLPYWQHAPLKLPNGNILLFDNGNYRNKYEDPTVGEASYNRAVEYKIDEENMTVELVWQFDYDKSIFTEATGDVDYFPENGHRLIGFMNGSGNTPKIVELDEQGNIVYDAFVNRGSNYYRIEKLNLYEGL